MTCENKAIACENKAIDLKELHLTFKTQKRKDEDK
jgi:hypothetical protein